MGQYCSAASTAARARNGCVTNKVLRRRCCRSDGAAAALPARGHRAICWFDQKASGAQMAQKTIGLFNRSKLTRRRRQHNHRQPPNGDPIVLSRKRLPPSRQLPNGAATNWSQRQTNCHCRDYTFAVCSPCRWGTCVHALKTQACRCSQLKSERPKSHSATAEQHPNIIRGLLCNQSIANFLPLLSPP